MDEEFVKRNTDCVYFLASPLTCKKGFECEYRHSETARLNPRDCWYWMAGNCLNPACGFRHPPLDGLAETASKTAVTNHQGVAQPVKKTNVPCYFYYNSFCNKGDSCPFLHGPSDIKPSGKLSKMAPLEEKTSVAADLGPAPVETPDVKVAPEIAKPEKIGPEKDLHKSTYSNAVAQSASPQLSDSASEGADVMKPNSMNRREAELSSQSTDQSTENQEEHYGREEWLESSPGFDVLVNDRTEESEHVTAVYLEQLNEEYQEHNHQNMRFVYEDNVEYDPSYPDIGIPFRQQEMRGFYEQHGKHTCNPVKEFQMCGRHRVVEDNWRQKMNFLPAGVTSIDRSDMDLRDFLKRRRVVDVHYPTHYDYREQNHTVDDGRFHGRLASRVEMRYTGSQVVQKMPLSPYSIAKRDKQRRTGRSRLNNKGTKQAKRQNILFEISNKKIVKKQRSYTEESSMFTGPKTLAEIKEEKKRQHK